MLISIKKDRYIGKTIKDIQSDSDDLNMTRTVKIIFTDGDYIYLSTDYRGDEVYISQYEDEK